MRGGRRTSGASRREREQRERHADPRLEQDRGRDGGDDQKAERVRVDGFAPLEWAASQQREQTGAGSPDQSCERDAEYRVQADVEEHVVRQRRGNS